MLTSYADDEALFDAIRAGAAGYALKDIRASGLVGAVRDVAAGKSPPRPPSPPPTSSNASAPAPPNPRPPSPASPTRKAASSDLIGEGLNQPPDRRTPPPRREDRQELRLLPAGQARHERRTQAAAYLARTRAERAAIRACPADLRWRRGAVWRCDREALEATLPQTPSGGTPTSLRPGGAPGEARGRTLTQPPGWGRHATLPRDRPNSPWLGPKGPSRTRPGASVPGLQTHPQAGSMPQCRTDASH